MYLNRVSVDNHVVRCSLLYRLTTCDLTLEHRYVFLPNPAF